LDAIIEHANLIPALNTFIYLFSPDYVSAE
jgi:hypothetical protein